MASISLISARFVHVFLYSRTEAEKADRTSRCRELPTARVGFGLCAIDFLAFDALVRAPDTHAALCFHCSGNRRG